MPSIVKKIPVYPLLFGLSPLLYLLAQNTNPLRLDSVLRAGAVWLAGGLALYALLWVITRQPQRAALLASLCLLLFFTYDPVYELVRGQSLLGLTFGKHRFLAPVWAAILAASAYGIVRKLERPQRLTSVYNFAGVVLLVFGLAGVTVIGGLIDVVRSIPVDLLVHNGQTLDSPV